MRKRTTIFIILTMLLTSLTAIAQDSRRNIQRVVNQTVNQNKAIAKEVRKTEAKAQKDVAKDTARARRDADRERRRSEEWEDAEQARPKAAEVRLKLERGGKVVINNWSGTVTVTGVDGDTLEAKATDEDGTLAPLESSVNGLTISLGGGPGRHFRKGGSADISVRVPRYVTAVEIEVLSGDITVSSIDGSVRTNAVSGNVIIECVKGAVNAKSVSGTVELKSLTGDVISETVSGTIEYVGDIRAGGSYRLKSMSGEVEMQIQTSAPGFTATLTTFSGEIETDFPLKVEKSSQYGGTNRQLVGRFGDGAATLSLNSFSGSARIVKAAANARKSCN